MNSTMHNLINLKCIGCLFEYEEFWQINPPGGYARSQAVICTDCCKLEEFKDIQQYLIDCGVCTLDEILNAPSFKRIK